MDHAAPEPLARLKIVIAFALVYTVWGSTYLAIRIAVATLPPFTLAGARFVIAGVLPMIVLRLRGVPLPTAAQWRNAAIVGLCLSLGGNGLVTWAEQRVSSSVAALLLAITPLWFVLFDGLRPSGRAPSRMALLGLLLGFAGVAWMLGPSSVRQELGSPPLFELFVLTLASMLWVAGSLYGKHHDKPQNVWMWTAAQMLCGGLGLVVVAAVSGEVARWPTLQVAPEALLAVLYLIAFGSWLGYGSYVWLLEHVSPAQLSTYALVNPAVAVVLGTWLLAEPWTPALGVGALSILSGVALVQLSQAA
jgi:drug/metabolite transporter (DMT)-like permease